MPAITINENGFVLDGPLVAGEPASVSVSGLSLAEGASLSLTCTARFPDALLASVALTQGDGGAWGGVLDTATKQAALYFLTARADEARAVVLELVDTANRDSLARVSAPMLNSSLLPKPDKAEGASPVYIPVPGPQGPQGEPGALRGKQYSYTVEEGDEIAVPADATSIVIGAAAEGVSIELVPPTLADGADYSLCIVPDPESPAVTVELAGTQFVAGSGYVYIAQRFLSGFVVQCLTPLP